MSQKQSKEIIEKRLATQVENTRTLKTITKTINGREHTFVFKRDPLNWVIIHNDKYHYYHKFGSFMQGTYDIAKRWKFDKMGTEECKQADDFAHEMISQLTGEAEREIDRLDTRVRELEVEKEKLKDKLTREAK